MCHTFGASLGDRRDLNGGTNVKFVVALSAVQISVRRHQMPSLINGPFPSNLNDDPGVSTVGLTLLQQESLLCALGNSSSVESVGSIVSFTVFPGVVSTNLFCLDRARKVTVIFGRPISMSDSFVPLVFSSDNRSAA